MSEINPLLNGEVNFTRTWFETELQLYFENSKFVFLITQWNLFQIKHPKDMTLQHVVYSPFTDINIVFLAGGTSRIPFVQKWIKSIFPNAQLKIEDQLEIITATGAAIHALQVLNREVEPYIRAIENPSACSIIKCAGKFEVSVYDKEVKGVSTTYYSMKRSIPDIIDELIISYLEKPQIIVLANDYGLKPDQLTKFRKQDFEKYGNLIHIATNEELSFNWYLNLKIEYHIGDWILYFDKNLYIELYEYVANTGEIMNWHTLDGRYYTLRERYDFQYVEKMFRIKLNQVHAVFQHNKEKVNSLYGPELSNYDFKSINFYGSWYSKSLILAQHLISDSEVSMLVQTYVPNTNNNLRNFIIQDWGFIHVPKVVKEYESITDIMGIDLGATKSVLATSMNNEIQVIPFDPFSEDLWTESVVSFDGEKPIIGKEAVRRLETNPESVLFDIKLVCNYHHRYKKRNQLTWPFDYNFKEGEEPRFVLNTSNDPQELSLAEINKIFLDQMVEKMKQYHSEFNSEETAKKVVITVPQYNYSNWINLTHLIHNAIKAAKLAGIEIIDIIEEIHADLLYYLSHEEYSEMIKPGMKVAIFDIGAGTGICRVYEISEQGGKRYGTCVGELNGANYPLLSGSDIDEIIIEELEKSIPEELRNKLKLRTLEATKKIKHRLSSEENIK